MIKVMIADDEYFVREGIRRTVNWDRYGCTLCSEAQNGIEGLEIAKAEHPDLVITDIKMPGIDGLAMAQEIQNYLPEARFIFITGFDEFELAKRAVKLSACDFLLKPINEDEFLNAIQKAVKECQKSDVIIDIARERMLLNMMRGNQFEQSAYKDLMAELRENYINLDELLVVALENDSYPDLLDSGNLTLVHRQTADQKRLARSFFPTCYTVECHPERLAILIPANHFHSVTDIESTLRAFMDAAKEFYAISLTAGVSAINYIDNLHECYEQSKAALKSKLYWGKRSIIYFEKMPAKIESFENRYILREEKELLIKLQACDKNGVKKLLNCIYQTLAEGKRANDSTIKQATISILLNSLVVLRERNIPLAQVLGADCDIYKKVAKLSTIQELHAWAEKSLLLTIDAIREANGYHDISIDLALQYIKDHFYEQLSLSDVAAQVHLSESHLSRCIKKTLGITFVEYVTKMRMEKALELLCQPNTTIQEVATQVGYSDYRYFSGCFKKYTGYVPSDFIKRTEGFLLTK